MPRYFGTNGMRGLFNELTPELALRAAQAFGAYCKFGKVLVARDARLTGECITGAVKSGLASAGCEVIDLGLCSAPAAEFMIAKTSASGLIIVTASHNPPEWNALKFVDGRGIPVSRERGEEIEKLMDAPKIAKWDEVKPMRTCPDAIAQHIKAIECNVDLQKIKGAKLSIVLDFGNGTSALYADMFRRVAKITAINSHIDGAFPGRNSEPTEANLKDLILLVKQGGYDCGFAWDGDADRFVMADEKGNFIIGDRVFAISVLFRLQKTKGKGIVTTVATSRAAEDIAKRLGAATCLTKVGAPYLCEAMVKERADIAGEEVGGVIWKEISLAKDGLATAMKMLEAIAEKPLAQWNAEVPAYFNHKAKIMVSKKNKEEIINKFSAAASGGKITKIDGVRIDFPNSWVIVRASGTEDCIRIFAEADSAEEAEKIVKKYEKIIKGDLKL